MAKDRYEIFPDDAGEYRWRLVSANNETVAQSEGYTTADGALRGIFAVQRIAQTAAIIRLPDESEAPA